METCSSGDAWTRTSDYLELTKPRITILVVVTTLVSFYLGCSHTLSLALLAHTLFGTALVAGGASAVNMCIERNLDAMMRRTETRPLPAGRLESGDALRFAGLISIGGMAYLVVFVNALTGTLAAITWLSYLLLYTPLKRRTWLCTVIGAVPGALPTAMGWAASTGHLSAGAWILFGILFMWQLPHFYAVGWMYREDYARAGFPMLPVVDATGTRTSRQATIFIVVLIALTVVPWMTGIAGRIYLAGAILLGICFLGYGIRFLRRKDRKSAKQMFIVSICYLPALMCLLMLNKA